MNISTKTVHFPAEQDIATIESSWGDFLKKTISESTESPSDSPKKLSRMGIGKAYNSKLDSILTTRYLNQLFFVRGFLLRTSAWSRVVVAEFPFQTDLRKKFVKVIATTPWERPQNLCVLP